MKVLKDIDNQRNIALYSALLKKHGDSFHTLNWGSKQSQELRFKILSEVGFSASDTVLDVGCGLGDLYAWLQKNNLDVQYHGLDLTPGLVNAASKKFVNVTFLEGTIEEAITKSQKFDFIVASGIFAHRQQEPVQFLNQTISEMYSRAKNGIAFNCLSSWRSKQDPGEFYADPIKTLEHCRSISERVVLRHDYHAGDFTVYLYRPDYEKGSS